MANNNSIIGIKDFFDRHNGLQRPTRFSLQFLNLPETLPKIPDDDWNPLSVMIPGRAINGIAEIGRAHV